MHPILSMILSVCLMFPSIPTTGSAYAAFTQPSGNNTAEEEPTPENTSSQSTDSDSQEPEPPTAKSPSAGAPSTDLSVSAPSVVLMEASTGQVIYEKEPHASLHPASITKIMTMILIFDALEEGKIALEDTVTVSEYAASMGGSQVFLEPGETQTVDTMLKCISVASANDA